MFIIENALKNLKRNRKRWILLGLVITAVLTAATVVMLLKDTAGEWMAGYRDGFGVEVGITTDWEYAQEHFVTEEKVLEDGSVEYTSYFEPDPVSMDVLESFADSENVRKAVFSGSARYASDSLQKVELDENMIVLDGMTPEELCDVYGVETTDDLREYISEKEMNEIFSYKRDTVGMIYGYSDPAHIRDFSLGKKKLKEGRFFENRGEVVIGDMLAEKNGIRIGDRIIISGGKKGDTAEEELTVVGIYTNLYANANGADIWVGFEKNDIIVGYDTFAALDFGGKNPFTEEIKYYVREPESVPAFEAEVRAKGLPGCYKLQYDVSGYESIVGPVEKAAAFAGDFGRIVLIAGACILTVLTIINIRDRKYEIAVLRAIGMPKAKVALGLITELTIVVGAAAVLGYALGCILIKPVIRLAVPANAELARAAAVSAAGILPILAAALALALIAGAVSTVCITKYEPMRIFRQAE